MQTSAAKQMHYLKSEELPFHRRDRHKTTVLSGGLTVAHERLVEAGLRELGYRSIILPTTNLDAYETGRTHCSNGLCNPAYFTIGNLLEYLNRPRDEQGLSPEQICERYVFYTAGSYGPCRFGMYESEYRLALESAGYPGFRVFVFQQGNGLVQSGWDSGVDFNAEFFLVHIKAFMVGDVLNELYHRLRPFELEPGASRRALDLAIDDLREAMAPPPPSLLRRISEQLSQTVAAKGPRLSHALRQVAALTLVAEQLLSEETAAQLSRAAEHLDNVAADRLRLKPVVKVTGEFWAQTTESDGNFHMFEFLEREGAEVLVEPLVTWMHYLLHVARLRDRELKGLAGAGSRGRIGRLWSLASEQLKLRLRRAVIDVTERVVVGQYERLRQAVGRAIMPPVDQGELERLGAPFYDPRLHGGEGHLEVGKTIHYTQDGLAHMVLSLKPFGCMPSTQSDGTQPAVLAAYPDILFLPVETSADGKVGALSRVQMMLAEARSRARKEWSAWSEEALYSMEELRGYVDRHPHLQRGLLPLPHDPDGASTALRFAKLVSEEMKAAGIRPLGKTADRTATSQDDGAETKISPPTQPVSGIAAEHSGRRSSLRPRRSSGRPSPPNARDASSRIDAAGGVS